ncbi:MAG: DNA gyrase subunit A [Halobacteria archaeon]
MSADDIGNVQYPDIEAGNVENVRVEDEMEQSYIDYAMSVIAGRALPDVRDGLKPVHRRILYAMEYEGITSNSSHRKSSSIVGTTMGNWHPHGDSAIYDTLVRMAQDFSMRYPLVDGQGNFGSIDGDPPAAMRYTEARMNPLSEMLLEDIDKDTVDWQSSYDDRIDEPTVLPAAFPNLLVNGASGIAVGMSTNIPPHNLGEIIDATVELINNPDADVIDLMDHVEGPDFPTGGKIVGRNPIRSAYETGKGKLRVRGVIEEEPEDNRLVIDEIPFQVDKSKMIEKIADLVNEGEIEGIRDIRDESDRDGIRVVIELKKDGIPDVVENQLLEKTRLEKTFGVINLALVDGQPRVLTLKETLQKYIDHRREVVRRRSEFELDEAEERAHVLEGRIVAIRNSEDVVELIRNAPNRGEAKEALQEEYDMSERQSDHVVRMQLGSLTSEEEQEIIDEHEDLQGEIERLEEILGSESELMAVIKDELIEVKERFGDERRTDVVEAEDEVTNEDLIPQEDVLVVLTRDGYCKRMSLDVFDPQSRGGKGIIGADVKDEDSVSNAFVANTHDYLLCFSNYGNAYWLKVYDLPEMGRTARGKSMVNYLEFEDGEEITATVPVDDFEKGRCLVMATKNGYIKRTCSTEFSNPRKGGIIATSLEEGDRLVDVEVSDHDNYLLVGTRDGMTICFDEGDVREMGRTARGVTAIDLEGDDEVTGLAVASDGDDGFVFTVTRDGYAKRTPLSEYRVQGRAGNGLIDIKTEPGTVSIHRVEGDEDVFVLSEEGQIIRTNVGSVSEIGRNTQGVILMRLEDDDRVASVAPMSELDTVDDEEESDEEVNTEDGNDVTEDLEDTEDKAQAEKETNEESEQ